MGLLIKYYIGDMESFLIQCQRRWASHFIRMSYGWTPKLYKQLYHGVRNWHSSCIFWTLCHPQISGKSSSEASFVISWFNSQGESKVLQYFGKMRHNSVAPDTFVMAIKMMNHIGLWDADLAWYPPTATHRIWLYWVRYRNQFLDPSGYCSVINCIFTFHTANVFGCFHGVMA